MIKIDNEFKSLIPALTTEEYAGLEQSILEEGCRDALITWKGTLIDGHNRYEICQKNGIPFKTSEKMFDSRIDVEIWIIINQFSRRNLTTGQKASLTEPLRERWEIKAKENLSLSGGDRKSEDKKSGFMNSQNPINTTKELSKISGLGEQTISRYNQISKKALKEIKHKVDKGEITINQAYVQMRREEAKKAIKEIEPISGKYRVIYADPPWKYGNNMPDYFSEQVDHYPLMTIKEICDMPIKGIAEENAVLFLWVTSPILEESFQVINAWGFKYKASFIWDKIKHNMGHYNSVRHELLLICVKGSCQPDINKLFDSVVSIERTEHSKKPEYFRQIIDELYPHGSRIELFARTKTEGWDVYGNQLSG